MLCQDLSLAGKGKGMSDTSTRSGMLWEVERILTECYELGTMPQILLMENVPQVHSEDNKQDFFKWQLRLEQFGYKSYIKDLIATDYGIPQTRNRCFMVSILGNYSYQFPKPIPLKLKLKDLLEDNVDEKYYLSDSMIQYIYSDDRSGKYNRKAARESCDRSIERGIAATITTTAGNRPTDNFIKIKNANSKGYLEAKEGDGIDISSRMEYHRGNVQKDKVQTLTTSGGNDRGVVENLRIRKLTPKECGRLMAVRDKDIDKIQLSDSAKYHIFGDAIVCTILIAIFGELTGKDYKSIIERWDYNE